MNRYQPKGWTNADAAQKQVGCLRRYREDYYRGSSRRASAHRSIATQTDVLDAVTGQLGFNRLGPAVTRSSLSASSRLIETQVGPREGRRPPASMRSCPASITSRPARMGPRFVAVRTRPPVIEQTRPARIQTTRALVPRLTASVLSPTTTVQATVIPEEAPKSSGKSKSAKRRNQRYNVLRKLANQPDTIDLSRLNKMQKHLGTHQGRKLFDKILEGLKLGEVRLPPVTSAEPNVLVPTSARYPETWQEEAWTPQASDPVDQKPKSSEGEKLAVQQGPPEAISQASGSKTYNIDQQKKERNHKTKNREHSPNWAEMEMVDGGQYWSDDSECENLQLCDTDEYLMKDILEIGLSSFDEPW
ncbi:uncharacterized protein LOC128667271 [Microplitis demolitor]|uniref:uncharacterized protein LOC128667271 n=1 Tax=Microplitis demolitor TaxID=69319 RepID=UPI00235B6993|nr:uncharacterized protein LOC128667271 [Microplitis demolitor]